MRITGACILSATPRITSIDSAFHVQKAGTA
jgi:hypothetical protein